MKPRPAGGGGALARCVVAFGLAAGRPLPDEEKRWALCSISRTNFLSNIPALPPAPNSLYTKDLCEGGRVLAGQTHAPFFDAVAVVDSSAAARRDRRPAQKGVVVFDWLLI